MTDELETIEVADEHAARRLDQFVALHLPLGFSRSQAQTMIADGHVTLNGTVETTGKRKLKSGDSVAWAVPDPKPAEPKGQDIALDILHEDEDLIVINKPAGLVVHPGAGNEDGTLVNALIHHCGDSLSGIGGVKRPGIVHRLDKDTSGVMVAAKNDVAHQHLSAQFADHGRTGALRRIYLALCWGTPERLKSTIDTHLGRSSGDRRKQAVVSPGQPDARHAVTHFEIIRIFDEADNGVALSLFACTLETGRTHQIRVHMAHIGHPLIGDDIYGAGFKTKANKLPAKAQSEIKTLHRQALHAHFLAFEHPKSGEVLEFETAPPADMQAVLDALASPTTP